MQINREWLLSSNMWFYTTIVVGSAVIFWTLSPILSKGTVWLKPDACRVLTELGEKIKKLEDGRCAWAGKFDGRLKTLKLYAGGRLRVPYEQVIAYEIER